MHSEFLKAVIVGAWALGLVAAGFYADFASIGTWTLLAATVITPSLITLRAWRQVEPTMSERIREVLRPRT